MGLLAWSTPSPAKCLYAPAEALASFKEFPRGLLDANARGGMGLAFQIRMLAGADNATREALRLLAPQANAMQKAAIGLGLAEASLTCGAQSAIVARKIESLVRASGDDDIARAYARSQAYLKPETVDAPTPEANGPDARSIGLDKDVTLVMPDPMAPLPLPGAKTR